MSDLVAARRRAGARTSSSPSVWSRLLRRSPVSPSASPVVRRRHLLPQHRARELHRLLRPVGRAGLRHVARPGAADRAGTGTAAPTRRELGCRHDPHDRCPGRHRGAPGARGVGDHPALDAGRATATPWAWSAAGAAWSSRCSTSRSRTACPADGHIADRLLADPVPAGARARLRGARRRHPAGRGRRRDRAGVLGRRGDRRDRRHRHRVRRPRRLRDRRRRRTASSSRRSSATRSGRARAPTSSSAGTTARRSPTGAPTRR